MITVTIIVTCIEAANDQSKTKTTAGIFFSKLPQSINMFVVLIVVAIPEGLQLTIAISLAFSLQKMHSDGVLLRKLDAPERIAGAEEIICGKTATITRAEMDVKQFFLDGKFVKNTRKGTFN